ncbi:hypothetical protein [Romboutsia hominis]|nr:hypothetical protein [Romboutsia hominis]
MQVEHLTNIHQFKINENINTKRKLYKNRNADIISSYKEEILNY